MSRHIAIITDDPGWHGKELHKAFCAKGHQCTNVSLTNCHFETGLGPGSLFIPGFSGCLPDGVFVRGVPGGSLEEVVFYLDILHALRELNVFVYNEVRAIERSVDKGMTSFLLSHAGLSTPPTWVGNNVHDAYSFIRQQLELGYKVVMKPLFGSQGKNLQLITKLGDMTDFTICNRIYYLQRYIETGSEDAYDWRLFVIGDQVVAMMKRQGSGWITNVATGGKCYPAVLDEKFTGIAREAVKAVDMYYGGVDVMCDQNQNLWVTEVNSIPAWRGLQSVSKIIVAEKLVEHFLSSLQQCSGTVRSRKIQN